MIFWGWDSRGSQGRSGFLGGSGFVLDLVLTLATVGSNQIHSSFAVSPSFVPVAR